MLTSTSVKNNSMTGHKAKNNKTTKKQARVQKKAKLKRDFVNSCPRNWKRAPYYFSLYVESYCRSRFCKKGIKSAVYQHWPKGQCSLPSGIPQFK